MNQPGRFRSASVTVAGGLRMPGRTLRTLLDRDEQKQA